MNRDVPFLQLDGLSRTFTVKKGYLDAEANLVRAVDEVSLAVRRGETMGLVGESGCGKSTLARMVVRLLEPSGGRILLEGESVWDGDREFRKRFPRRVQMVFQDPFSSLNPRRSVGAAIREPLDIHKLGSRAERRDRTAQLLEWVGLLPEHARRYPHEFSGGQRQRVAVARALALNPDLVALDEAVSALDVSIQAQVLNLLAELQRKLDLTYLFISHDLSVVSHVSDRVAVMYLGRIVELAEADELYRNPLHPYTQTLLAAIPVPDPDVHKGREVQTEENEPRPIGTGGCVFAPRCDEATAECSSERPELRELSSGHLVACIHR